MTRAGLAHRLLSGPDDTIGGDPALTRTSRATGVIFIFAGLVKFVFHHWELHAFRDFGLPWPAALEILAGVLETFGGVLLVACRWTVPTVVLLAATMGVAIYSSGIRHGDVIPSLTLAPALLIAILYLLIRALARVSAPPDRGRASPAGHRSRQHPRGGR